jgi:hypothetical protein
MKSAALNDGYYEATDIADIVNRKSPDRGG